jgi:tetratricopeptide (TPR) repeat protein
MKALRTCGMASLVLALTALPTFAQPAPPPAAATEPAAAPADPLAAFIATIESEENPTQVTMTYGQAAAKFPDSAKLHDAYMRRVLKLGMPELAYQPAEVLAKLDPDNALAPAVIAHMQAQKGEFDKALESAVKAAERLPDDPFVLDVAGQLVAWYDLKADKSTIAQPLQERLAKIRDGLSQRKGFTDAYEAAKTYFEQEAKGTIFLPEHLRAAAGEQAKTEPAGEREQRVRELLDEIDRGREVIETEPVYVRTYVSTPTYYYPTVYEPWWGPWGYWGTGLIVVARPWYYYSPSWRYPHRRLIIRPPHRRRVVDHRRPRPHGGVGVFFSYSGSSLNVRGRIGSVPGGSVIRAGDRGGRPSGGTVSSRIIERQPAPARAKTILTKPTVGKQGPPAPGRVSQKTLTPAQRLRALPRPSERLRSITTPTKRLRGLTAGWSSRGLSRPNLDLSRLRSRFSTGSIGSAARSSRASTDLPRRGEARKR